MLVGATAYRMLCGWEPHTVRENDVVLVWGGSGGLGSQAIQIVRARGGIPVAVAINEAVEAANELSTEDSGRFVNGILGRIAREAE